MAANDKSQEPRSSKDIARLLELLGPGTSSAVLDTVGKTVESREMVRYAFNPWHEIKNHSLSGFGFGVRYVNLPRMCLIHIKTWEVPVILARAGGFAIGSFTSAGAFPSSAVGSKAGQRLQFPAESIALLVGAYGRESPTHNYGFVELRSLAAETDVDKLESTLLFRAVMETAADGSNLRGVDICLEDLPKFLAGDAQRLLKRAFDTGVEIGGEVFKLPRTLKLRGKGEDMISDMAASVAMAANHALNEVSGILPKTKSDLIAAGKGLKDVKVMPDRLDNWLLTQFPSFSLDTDVERAQRANASVTDAIRENGLGQNDVTRQILENQNRTLDELSKANAVNAELAKALSAATASKTA